jgi:hypothetical protein
MDSFLLDCISNINLFLDYLQIIIQFRNNKIDKTVKFRVIRVETKGLKYCWSYSTQWFLKYIEYDLANLLPA